MKGKIAMNTTAIFPGFETLVKPFKFAASPYEYKVTTLRECPTPEAMQQCETPDKAADYWRLHIATHPHFNPDCECLAVLLLNTENLLALLRRETPKFFELAEVVGKWVWIQFDQKQPVTVTAVLSELGFHWNNKRQSWQHPCGLFRDRSVSFDPRQKYGSYFAASIKPA